MRPRIRTIKPELFKHEELYDMERETGLPLRLAWAGLFTCADREGRFPWRPRALKAEILPYDDVDFSRVLHAWATRGFVVKYASPDGKEWGYIPSWADHQVINNRESPSDAPDPATCETVKTSTREPRVPHASATRGQSGKAEGKGREGNGREGNGTRTHTSVALREPWKDQAARLAQQLNGQRADMQAAGKLVLSYFNASMGTHYRWGSKVEARIMARLAESRSASLLFYAVDGATKDDFIMDKFRRVSTIFRDAEQVDRFFALSRAKRDELHPTLAEFLAQPDAPA